MIKNEEFYSFLEKMASLIAETFGSSCEVTISDLSQPNSTIMAIFNNHITGRNVGDPLIPQALERESNDADEFYINYQDYKNGRKLKTSTIRFEHDDLHLAFCINYDCSNLEVLHNSLTEFLAMQTDDINENERGGYVPIIEDAVREAIKNVGKPVRLMNKRDRLKVLQYLASHGIMQMQKSVQTVALLLGISRYTVYNYLNELNEEREAE